jgi:hypothetical protein
LELIKITDSNIKKMRDDMGKLFNVQESDMSTLNDLTKRIGEFQSDIITDREARDKLREIYSQKPQ